MKGCRIFGYFGSIDSSAKDGSTAKHNDIRAKTSTGKVVEADRVSDGRYQFHGRPTPKKPNVIKRLFR